MPFELTSLMLLSEFVDYLDRISGTPKRLEMNEIMKQLFLADHYLRKNSKTVMAFFERLRYQSKSEKLVFEKNSLPA